MCVHQPTISPHPETPSLPTPAPTLMPQPHMHNTHLISRGDVLMTHLSSHFIDAGPSVATVALNQKATIGLAHQEEDALIYLEWV